MPFGLVVRATEPCTSTLVSTSISEPFPSMVSPVARYDVELEVAVAGAAPALAGGDDGSDALGPVPAG